MTRRRTKGSGIMGHSCSSRRRFAKGRPLSGTEDRVRQLADELQMLDENRNTACVAADPVP